VQFSISYLRRWFAGAAIAVVLVVAGVYFYAHHRVQNALKQVPEKIGLDVQQTANGFSVSKSEQGRTLFKVDASKAVQFKEGGRVELHEVVITVYGRDSDRYDRIYGSDFEYNQQSGDIAAKGEVQIDLEANPEGVANPDQSPPRELKSPIHLSTHGLVFNQKTGNAYTKERVEFQLPQARGSGVGLNYLAKENVLTLESQVKLVSDRPGGQTLEAARAVVTKDPHQVLLEQPRIETIGRKCRSDKATLYLRADDTLDRVLASENVLIQIAAAQPMEARAEQLELTMEKGQNTLRTAVLSGAVTADVSGDQPIHANAGRVQLDFAGQNSLTKVRAEDAVKIVQPQKSNGSAAPQNLELTAAMIDFFWTDGNRLDRAETFGAAQIALLPSVPAPGPETLVTAQKFQAEFDRSGQLSQVHGAPNARIVNRNPGEPDQISTSDLVDAMFQPGNGIESIVQQGRVAYADGVRTAWSDLGRYTPVDEVLMLIGSSRVVEAGMTTTAHSMRLHRATRDAFADGNVKTTYSDLKAEPDGALLASSSPIHVTANEMAAHGNSRVALYTGNVRLWQDANAVEAPSIEFDRDKRSMIATGGPDKPVSTVLVQTDTNGNVTPVAITSSRLTYVDGERKAHFDQNVTAKGADVVVTAREIDAFLQPHGQTAPNRPGSAGKLDRIVATDQVVVTQPDRRATGDQLVYTSADDKFVLTGGPPSIFDAEHGKITGVSLTFFRRDDRVLVEGNNKFPTVTQTRVAR
jgi:lipopolysaccharide export system protein LptA